MAVNRARAGVSRAVGLLHVAAMVTACEPSSPSLGSVVTVDSAGVEIITIGPPNIEMRSWRTASSPDVGIGLESGSEPYFLYGVQAATRLSDTRIVIGQENELRFFDAGGAYLSTVGREGEGPGEFSSIGMLSSFAGDSILVFDQRLQRASVFDPTGRFVDSWSVYGAGAPAFQMGVGVSRKGDLVIFAWIDSAPNVVGPYTTSLVVGIIDRTDQSFQTLDTIGSVEEAQVERNGRLTRAFRPFGRKSDVAVSQSFIFVLDALAERSIHVYSSAGELVRILRFDIPRLASTSDRVTAWKASFLARHSEGSISLQESWAYGFDRTPPVDSIPLFRSLEVDVDGNLCAERYAMTETEARVYWCFSDGGELMRSITVDGGISQDVHPFLSPQVEVGGDYILGVWVDDLGVEHVRSYSLVRDTTN